ncbi:DNA repair protein RAD51 homolog 4-like [Daktulosphaira vitifoliae]|uniref:DNA repair protein RAD51 homolog 4-like n=1 Tax=Daktulosphaira vitifoliae TaxID=58002 RepID=UPI0021AAD789|nr:DNA repair protein RAD51 homolog 4-like [Daktulosphaira vitifoliae]
MIRLKVPLLPNETIICKLFSRNIFTVFDFLQKPSVDLQEICNMSCKDVSKLKDALIVSCSVFINGYSLYKNKPINNLIKTGILELDELLNGGLHLGTIYEFCGPSSCGKTILCYNIIANYIYFHSSKQIIYIDTKFKFSIKRLKEIIALKCLLPLNQENTILKKVIIYSISDVYNLFNCLHNLKPNPEDIIIIDSITVPYLSFVGSSKNEGLCYISHISSVLHHLTQKNVTIIITNLAVKQSDYFNDEPTKTSTENNEFKPAIGKYWLHIPNTRLMLSCLPQNKISINISKSVYLPLNKNCNIKIYNGGIL